MVKHLISDQNSYRKQLQVLDGRYLHKHYVYTHTHSCTPTQMRWWRRIRELVGTGALHLSDFPSLQLPSCENRKPPRWRPRPWERPKLIQSSGITGNVSGLSQQLESKEENLRREQQKQSPHSWLAMTPHTGQAGIRTSCSWRWGHSLTFTTAKECNLEFKITQINCLLKQNSALFCLGIYIIQIKKSAKKPKLCWCMRLEHYVQRRKSHVNIQYFDNMAHSEKQMRPGTTVPWKRVARGTKSGVQRSWWWPGDRACVAFTVTFLWNCVLSSSQR